MLDCVQGSHIDWADGNIIDARLKVIETVYIYIYIYIYIHTHTYYDIYGSMLSQAVQYGVVVQLPYARQQTAPQQ